MKKRTFKVRFFYGYMDLSPFTYIWLTPNIGCGSAEADSSGRWVFLLSPFAYICFANIGCGSEKHIQVNLICFSLAFRYIWLTPNIGCGSAEAN